MYFVIGNIKFICLLVNMWGLYGNYWLYILFGYVYFNLVKKIKVFVSNCVFNEGCYL